jgi:hypothetical protein
VKIIPQVRAKNRVKGSLQHSAPVRPLSELPARSKDVAKVLGRVESGLDPSIHLCAAVTAVNRQGGLAGPTLDTAIRLASPRSRGDDTMYGQWQAALLAADSAELFNVSGQKVLGNVLGSYSLSTFTPGKPATLLQGATLGLNATGQQFLSNRLNDAETISLVRKAAATAGCKLESVHVWHPLGKAVSARLRITNLAAFRRTGFAALNRSPLQSAAEFEGVYLVIDGPDGTELARFESTGRPMQGGQWEAPGANFGYAHG